MPKFTPEDVVGRIAVEWASGDQAGDASGLPFSTT
jgi:hypothetical protein